MSRLIVETLLLVSNSFQIYSRCQRTFGRSFQTLLSVENKETLILLNTLFFRWCIHYLIREWWTLSDSNRPPPECKSGALPDELRALIPSKWWARLDLN